MNIDSKSRNNIWKWLVLLVITCVSIAVSFPLKEKLRFGLDLKGGAEFMLGIDEGKLKQMVVTRNVTNATMLACFANEEALAAAIKTQPEVAALNAKIEQEMDEIRRRSDARLVEIVRRRVDGMGMNEPTIQSLPDKHGVLVQLPGFYGTTEVAGIAGERTNNNMSRESAKESLLSAAFLEFRLLAPNNDELVSSLMASDDCPRGYVRGGSGFMPGPDFADVVAETGYASEFSLFHVEDPRYEFVFSQKQADGSFKPYFVERWAPTKSHAPITGDYLTHAAVGNDEFGRLTIEFEFNDKGASLFREVTRRYRKGSEEAPEGRCLAILLDGKLVSAPVIQAEIGNRGQITGTFTPAQAAELANNLNAGALPAPLMILADSSISPTVGEGAKQAGMVAALLGFMLVAIFMIIYYWYAGLVADVALFLDVVLLPAALVLVANVLGVFGADTAMGGGGSTQLPVLTMPGIAGLVLTLGMAVDANVIIFERIREEFAAQASVGTAIKNGYGRAFTAILDSNITTITTGVILFLVGTGPVRGFAITLTAGVLISMFTAVVVTRLVFEHTVQPDAMKPFKMLNIFKKTPNIDFVKMGKVTVIASFAIVFLTCAIFFIRAFSKPESVLSVDLTGGTSIQYECTVGEGQQKPTVEDVRKAIGPFDPGAVVQYSHSAKKGDLLLIKTSYTTEKLQKSTEKAHEGVTDVVSHITRLLQEAPSLKEKGAAFALSEQTEIGSAVGADLKKSGAWAVCLSLCAILIYVAFRFEFGFGLGALVALAHDALISLGLFSLCGGQVSLLVITALLTIIGYSVNDTIVVFDRIREDLRKDQKTGFKELCNLALNKCLSRTVITSVTTFFAVIALFAFGDGPVFDFALTMLFGVIAGTFSSVFIATPIMMWFYKGRRPQFEKAAEQQ